MSEIVYIPSSAASALTALLWELSDPNPTRGTTGLFEVVKALDESKWLVVPVDAILPILATAELNRIANILLPWVGHGIEQVDIDRLERALLNGRGKRLVVYEEFPPIFKMKDENNPTGLGRTRAQMVDEGKLAARITP